MKNYVKGIYKRSIFKSDKGYVIGIFKVLETNEEEFCDYINKTITFTGIFPDLKEEDKYIFYGEVVNHPKYGIQYDVKESERIKPEDRDGIIAFLSSDLFKGVGEKLATNIVDVLGKNTLEIILSNPDELLKVPKMTEEKAKTITSVLNKYEESHKTIVYLTELGFNLKDALSIYNFYKDNTIYTVENNIYKLIDDIDDINFNKIDKLREKLNIEENDEKRIESCIYYIMSDILFQNSDTYLFYDEIKKNTIEYLNFDIDDERFNNYLDVLRYEGKIVKEEDRFYTASLYKAEMEVVNKIKVLENAYVESDIDIDTHIEILEKGSGISYNSDQKAAIKKALLNNITIITGGPGTGKTTIIKAIVDLYIDINKLKIDEATKKIALLSPTGRASKRMSESTNFPAYTIHRFLKWNKDTNEFQINETNKSEAEFIIIDESSMIDLELLGNLFKGLTDRVKLVFVGDYYQLPSVGCGQVLKDLIESDMIDTIYLNQLYRQSNDSYIPTLAYEIKNNDVSDDILKQKDDFRFIETSNDNIINVLKQLCLKLIDNGYDYRKVQLMAPMYAGENGIDNINRNLQSIFNPSDDTKREVHVGDIIFRENDKVLQLTNMPDENVFNGDIGVIKYILYSNTSKSKKDEIYVDFDGNVVKYLPKDFNKLKHAYIISIHKSQGSEFDFVILPICMSYYRMLYRKLIYTAITRAKKKLIVVGDLKAFRVAVMKDSELNRKTFLKEKLENMYN